MPNERPVEQPVRPLLLTEHEMLDIVDTLIRDRAFNRPAAVAIAMVVGAAVEAEVRERCAKLCDAYAAERHTRDEPGDEKRIQGHKAVTAHVLAQRIRGA